MWPRAMASLKRTGSITVAVNLSPARASLLDSVSFMRTFRFVPIGTKTGVVARGAARRRRGFVLCAVTIIGSAVRIENTITSFFTWLSVIRLLLMLVGFQKAGA